MLHLSDMTEPLRRLEDKDVEWQWLKQHSIAFNTVKTYLTETPVLKYYDVKDDVTIQCDASETGLGAVLMQNGQKQMAFKIWVIYPRLKICWKKSKNNFSFFAIWLQVRAIFLYILRPTPCSKVCNAYWVAVSKLLPRKCHVISLVKLKRSYASLFCTWLHMYSRTQEPETSRGTVRYIWRDKWRWWRIVWFAGWTVLW